MRKMKKLLSVLLAATMTLAMAAPSFAQDVSGGGKDDATITVQNASRGETYSIYKLFDATVAAAADPETGEQIGSSIAYTGDIPDGLTSFFNKDGVGNITETAAARDSKGEMSEGLRSALETWAGSATPVKSVVSEDGSDLVFSQLDYGYYVVRTTQGDQAITVTSTYPNAKIYDKNSTTPGKDLSKKVGDGTDASENVAIGDTVTYTVSFKTANYDGANESAKKIVSYTIKDTLPSFLAKVQVTSFTIDGKKYPEAGNPPQFDTNKEIIIPWVDANNNSLYNNGAEIVIQYTATVTEDAVIDGNGNENKVTVTWTNDDDTTGNTPETEDSKETIYTYALAIQKVDENGTPLAGAQFSVAGITVQQTVTGADGDYTVTASGKDAAGNDLNTGALKCDSNGVLIIRGVKNQDYIVTETTAPDGYNKLVKPITVPVTKTKATSTTTTKYIDADGNVVDTQTDTVVSYENTNLAATVAFVVNQTGAILPSTGGIGTTIFYAAGIILMAGAVFFVVRRKRA